MDRTSSDARRATRRLTAEDREQSRRLGEEGFGADPPGQPAPPAEDTSPAGGRHSWGRFAGDRLLARAVGLELGSWWHGTQVPTCGVADVTVAAEHRGEGLLRELFRALLEEASDRGEPLSTLYPTAPGIYRRLGYEVVCALDEVDLVTADLGLVRPAEGTTVRRATVADVPAVREAYDAWAAAQNGPLTRRGAGFGAPDAAWLEQVTATTLAEDADGRVVGFARWDRGTGYDEHARIAVPDLVGLTADAHRALWRVLGSFSTVAPTVRLTTSGADAARLVLPTSTGRRVVHRPYMLRVHDPARALTGLRLAPGSWTAQLRVAGDVLGVADGGYRLVVEDGVSRCERADVPPDAATYTTQGLALAFAGTQDSANLRLAGHLSGRRDDDRVLDLLLHGRPVHVRDYF
ncbi:enhanced intracellular survival protein Eis [Nocardioides sp. Arc9.136]|uniref:GNAT family N-acetyltransferase n=1 Tax=Nocardioides sp. Arc9.136 TaxID=2996826 RepID=UPI002666C544|nr:GNAT family N-acetyltransferase [Nocardioides sp. Arc9.136]WKN47985.1 GNAT family N-acetyltransferase [Nocardioides sp. Arc9.136]